MPGVTSSRTTPKAQSGQPDSREWYGGVRRMRRLFLTEMPPRDF